MMAYAVTKELTTREITQSFVKLAVLRLLFKSEGVCMN